MSRYIAAVAVAFSFNASWVCAQGIAFTVLAPSAQVHRGPSTGSAVLGNASRGAVLEVTRELGSWVRVSWPAAEDGIGYVHLSTGRIGPPSAVPVTNVVARPASSSPTGRPAPAGGVLPAGRADTTVQPGVVVPAGSLTPVAHLVGLGGRMGVSALGLGASVRAGMGKRFKLQLEVSRQTLADVAGSQRLTSVQWAPSLLYSLPDKVTDYVWVRPYVGGGVIMHRTTLAAAGSSADAAGSPSATDHAWGRQFFGGTEVTFASMPRFRLSADYGYRWPQTPRAGFDLGRPGMSVSGHWYVK